MQPVRERLGSGLRWGLYFAVLCSAVALLTSLNSLGEVKERYHLSSVGLILLYFACGIVGGLTFGLLLPLGKSLVGAISLGVLVALPVYFLAGLAIYPKMSPTSGRFLFVWLFASVPLGSIVGALTWFRWGRRPSARSRIGP